jgi:hypothetical protein
VFQARIRESKYEAGWRHRTKAGEIFDVHVVSQPITYDGRAAHFVVATDVTEQLTYRARLLDKMGMKTSAELMAYAVRHHLAD